MIQELENYVNAKKESLEKNGIKVGMKNAEIRPKFFKLNITLETHENVASFTVWDKGSKLSKEADVIVLNVPTGNTTVTKSLQPQQPQELIGAFDELTRYLIAPDKNDRQTCP
jgi:beta-glucanase (GH16 family)